MTDPTGLRPEFREFLGRLAPADVDGELVSLHAERALAERACRVMWGEPEDVPEVRDIQIPVSGGILSARVYGRGTPEDRPGVVFFHGGRWVVGSLETHDGVCRTLSNRSDTVVISVAYRLAPENRFPVGVNDAWEAYRYVADHPDLFGVAVPHLAVAGESAGANLAAVVARRARDAHVVMAAQVLVCPIVDTTTDTVSYRELGDGFYLTRAAMRQSIERYLGSSDASHPDVAVLRAPDLRHLCPALVVTAEFDPLHDEGVAYARKLASQGVEVTHLDVRGAIHGFFIMKAISGAAMETVDNCAAFLASRLDRRK